MGDKKKKQFQSNLFPLWSPSRCLPYSWHECWVLEPDWTSCSAPSSDLLELPVQKLHRTLVRGRHGSGGGGPGVSDDSLTSQIDVASEAGWLIQK